MVRPDAEAVNQLEERMRELSETWSASWMHGVKFALWDALQGKPMWLDQWEIPGGVIAQARHLSERIGGWIAWTGEMEKPQFVPLGEWLKMYEGKQT